MLHPHSLKNRRKGTLLVRINLRLQEHQLSEDVAASTDTSILCCLQSTASLNASRCFVPMLNTTQAIKETALRSHIPCLKLEAAACFHRNQFGLLTLIVHGLRSAHKWFTGL